MTECKSIEEKIIAGECLNSEEELHLLACRKCQLFSRIHSRLCIPTAPSPELDSAVMAQCMPLVKKNRHGFLRRISFSTAAACIAAVFAICLAFGIRHTSQNYSQLTNLEQWLFSLDMENEELTDLELAIANLEIPPYDSAQISASVNINSPVQLHYDIISLEMDLTGR